MRDVDKVSGVLVFELFFTVDYAASAVVLYFICFVHFVTIMFNFKRIKSLKKCNT